VFYCGRGRGGRAPDPPERDRSSNPIVSGRQRPVCHAVHRKPGSTPQRRRRCLWWKLKSYLNFKKHFIVLLGREDCGASVSPRVRLAPVTHG
jgi:hypothetical protein